MAEHGPASKRTKLRDSTDEDGDSSDSEALMSLTPLPDDRYTPRLTLLRNGDGWTFKPLLALPLYTGLLRRGAYS